MLHSPAIMRGVYVLDYELKYREILMQERRMVFSEQEMIQLRKMKNESEVIIIRMQK